MKKTFVAVVACLLGMQGLMAQSLEELDAQNRELLKTYHARNFSKHWLKTGLAGTDAKPMSADKMVSTKAGEFRSMPTDHVWFPGEWEEVQAIVVTPLYNHYSSTGQQVSPLIPGYGTTRYSENLVPYVSRIDTTSSMGQVSFYLMDAIQLGGAQAWVRVENEADTAAVLSHLATKGLRHNNIHFLAAPGNSFWFRDCGPICFYYGAEDSIGMLDFEYYAGRAMDDSLPVYIHREFGLPNFPTSIEWEGGNCLVDGTGYVFSSDQIYEYNTDNYGQIVWDGVNPNSWSYSSKTPLTHQQVNDSLAALIGPRGVGILPHFLHDGGTGHIDLYADMFDENQFVFSVMPTRYRTWEDYAIGTANMATLTSMPSYFGNNYKSAEIPFPLRTVGNGGAYFLSEASYEAYTRTYSNHTFVNNVIIQPCFTPVGEDGWPTVQWDRERIAEVQKAYPGYTLYCVDVSTFDGTGGAIHCITKQIPSDSPVRILHPSVTGDQSASILQNAQLPMSAIISNNTGIASASILYRTNGGDWQTATLASGSDSLFSGWLTGLASGDTVDYYISATSNGGKTITKPFTATQGGYYTFVITGGTAGITPLDPEATIGQFYPNPTTGMATIQVETGRTYSVTLFDAAGRYILSSTTNEAGQFTVDASALQAGIYTALFAAEGNYVVRKLVVK